MRSSPMPGGWSLCPGWGYGCWFPLCGFNLLFAGDCTPCTPGWEEADTQPPSNQYQDADLLWPTAGTVPLTHLTHTGPSSSGNTDCSQPTTPNFQFQSHHSLEAHTIPIPVSPIAPIGASTWIQNLVLYLSMPDPQSCPFGLNVLSIELWLFHPLI